MAFSHGTDGRIWLDGFAASCFLNEVSLEGEIDSAETTTLCKTHKTYIPGLVDSTVSLSGFYDTNTASPATTMEFFLEARKRTIFPVVFAPQGAESLGETSYLLNGFLTSFTVGTTVDDAATVETEYQSTTGFERGIVAAADAARTATGSTDAATLNNGSSTANGGSAVLSVSAVTGTSPTLNVVVEHSADDNTWVTLATFSQQNAVNAEYLAFSGSVEQYIRVSWTIAGTTPSFTFNVAVHRN